MPQKHADKNMSLTMHHFKIMVYMQGFGASKYACTCKTALTRLLTTREFDLTTCVHGNKPLLLHAHFEWPHKVKPLHDKPPPQPLPSTVTSSLFLLASTGSYGDHTYYSPPQSSPMTVMLGFSLPSSLNNDSVDRWARGSLGLRLLG